MKKLIFPLLLILTFVIFLVFSNNPRPANMTFTPPANTTATSRISFNITASDNQYFETAYESSHYKVYFNSSDEEIAKVIIQDGEEVYPVDVRIYGGDLPNKTIVYVFHSLENARAIDPTHVPPVISPDSSGGGFDTFEPLGDGLKLYNIALPGNNPVLIARTKAFMAHETGHRFFYYLYSTIRKPVRPQWMDEGIAMYAGFEAANNSNLNEYDFGAARQEINANAPTSLATLDQLQASGNTLELFYGEASTVIYYITGKYGEQGLRMLLYNYNQTANLNDAFVKTFNMTQNNFEVQYDSTVQKLAAEARSGTEFYNLLKNSS